MSLLVFKGATYHTSGKISSICIKFIKQKKFHFVLNEARDGAPRAAGRSKFHKMGAAWRKALPRGLTICPCRQIDLPKARVAFYQCVVIICYGSLI